MRTLITILACLLTAPGAWGQNTSPSPPTARLDDCLKRWEAGMTEVKSFRAANLTRKDADKDGTVHELRGEARFMKPDYAYLRLDRVDNPNLFEQTIITPKYLFDYRAQTKTVYAHELPPKGPGLKENSALALIGGIGAEEAKTRFTLTITKENRGFVYIRVLPRLEADKRDFAEAELVFQASDMRPRRLWFLAVNGHETTWNIPELDTNAKLTANDFVPTKPAADWKVETVPLQRSPMSR